MLETALLGLLASLLTKASQKLKISQTYLCLGLAVILGAGYYIATNYYQVERQKLVEIIGGVYASSQVIYNLGKKLGLLDK